MTPQDPDKEESGPVIPDKKLLKTVKKLLYKFEKWNIVVPYFFNAATKPMSNYPCVKMSFI